MIRNIILKNYSFIIDCVEKYNYLLSNFKYEKQVLTLYNLILNYNNDKLKTYINLMIDDDNFNSNDECFIMYLLYYLNNTIHIFNRNDYEYKNLIFEFISNKHITCKIIGFARLLEFFETDYFHENNKYTYFWFKKNYKNIFRSFQYNSNKKIILQYEIGYDDKIMKIKLEKNYNLYINIIYDLNDKNIKLITDINCYFSKHDDIYYITKYEEINNIKYNINSDSIIEKINNLNNPFISSASTNLDNILPFILGNTKEIGEYYEGVIENGKFIKKNNVSNINLSSLNIINIYKEIKKLIEIT